MGAKIAIFFNVLLLKIDGTYVIFDLGSYIKNQKKFF